MSEVCPHLRFVGRPSSTYTLRNELAEHPKLDINVSSLEKPSFFVPVNPTWVKDNRSNWSRDFSIPGKYTLEQLNEIILCLLGWDKCHLYEFRIARRVYANLVFMEEDDPRVEIDYPCVSCDIPLLDVGLSVGDTFTYIFDFSDYHVFILTVLGIQDTARNVPPALLRYHGKNIIQYPGTLSNTQEQAYKNRTPEIIARLPIRDRCRIRFIRDKNASVLKEWRATRHRKENRTVRMSGQKVDTGIQPLTTRRNGRWPLRFSTPAISQSKHDCPHVVLF